MEARGASGRSARVRLAALTALASTLGCILVVALGTPGAEAGAPGDELQPDLVTLGIGRNDIVVEKRGKHRFLRLTNEVGNTGSGPLDVVRGALGGAGACPDGQYEAIQRVYGDTNGIDGFQRPGDSTDHQQTFGCMSFHDAPGHLHWHVLDFARYELRRASTGKRISSKKVGFCVIDTGQPYPDLPGSPEDPFYPAGKGCGSLEEAPTSEGLSIGWSDVYFFGLPGQSLDITNLHRGRYCLISTADPTGLIEESDDSNNTRTVKLKMRPRKLRFKKLDGPCRL